MYSAVSMYFSTNYDKPGKSVLRKALVLTQSANKQVPHKLIIREVCDGKLIEF